MTEFTIPERRALNEAPVTMTVEALVRRLFSALHADDEVRHRDRTPDAPAIIEAFVRSAIGLAWPGPPGIVHIPGDGALAELFDAPDVSDRVCVRFIAALCSHSALNLPRSFDDMRTHRPFDLEGLASLLGEIGVSDRQITKKIVQDADYDFRYGLSHPFTHDFSDDDVWPYFARRPAELTYVLDIAAGKGEGTISPGAALLILKRFPKPPSAALRTLYALALGKKKTCRSLAQQILARDADRDQIVRDGLATGGVDVRTNAATWLGAIGGAASLDALQRALAAEQHDIARAAIVDALARLSTADAQTSANDDDLADEARAGLEKKIAPDLAWFPFDRLPTVHAASGAVVDAAIVTWLVVSSFRLKSATPTELLRRRVAHFEPADRRALGRFVLDAWIAYDTIPVEPAEAERRARAWARSNSPYVGKSEESLYVRILPQCLLEPVGSAIGAKGILALVGACCDGAAAATISAYLEKWYGTRPSHGKSLIEVLAWIDDARAAQVLFAVADRFRTKSFQEAAGQQLALLAARKHWSVEELADRTIPTAGFDAEGNLQLAYGEPVEGARTFVARLGSSATVALVDGAGRTIAALPAAEAGEDDAVVKRAATTLAAAKKLVKSTSDAQRERLYQAMCGGRVWHYADVERFLFANPIVRALASRLVWAAQTGDDAIETTFRPRFDGTLIDANDKSLSLGADARIRLAHDVLVDGSVAAAWLAHFARHAIAPAFAQFGTEPFTPSALQNAATAIATFEGFVVGGFALRTALERRDWTRGTSHDANRYYSVERRFSSLGMQAVLAISGNEVPELDHRVVLKTLYFERLDGAKRFNLERIALARVPRVLLSEAVAAVRAFAASGSGFDPAWELLQPDFIRL